MLETELKWGIPICKGVHHCQTSPPPPPPLAIIWIGYSLQEGKGYIPNGPWPSFSSACNLPHWCKPDQTTLHATGTVGEVGDSDDTPHLICCCCMLVWIPVMLSPCSCCVWSFALLPVYIKNSIRVLWVKHNQSTQCPVIFLHHHPQFSFACCWKCGACAPIKKKNQGFGAPNNRIIFTPFFLSIPTVTSPPLLLLLLPHPPGGLGI